MKKNEYSFHVRIWVNKGANSFLGSGKVLLLENIEKTGSIAKAALEQGMAYRHAWQMVEDMNKQAKEPLVKKSLGGKGGGGASLTDAGKHVIRVFHELESKVCGFLEQEATNIEL